MGTLYDCGQTTDSTSLGLVRQLEELEKRLIEEETTRRINELVEQQVRAIMASDSVQQSLTARLTEERKALEQQVC